eukprot:1859601-Prymnesium_polylepis.1
MPARRLRRPLETWQSVMITLGTENDANETTGPNKAIPISIRKPDVLIKDTRRRRRAVLRTTRPRLRTRGSLKRLPM